MAKPKVLFIGPFRFRPNVGEKNIKIIYPTLLEPLHGCEFHLLHGMDRLPEYTCELTSKYGMTFHYASDHKLLTWLKKTIHIVKKHDIDVLTNVFFGYQFGMIAALAAKLTQRKAVARFAANEILVRKHAGTYNGFRGSIRQLKEKIMQKFAVNYSNEVLAMSPWEEQRLKSIANKPEKVFWCMRGVDISHYAPKRSRKNSVAHKFLFIGRGVIEKGYELIENVAKRLETSHQDIQFYFAGTFKAQIKGNRHYLGYYPPDKIVDLYNSMDALVLPSQSEGFANVIVEAMATGLPCIITKSYHEKYFVHRENALLIDLSEESLEENILQLNHDEVLYRRLSVSSRELAVDEFDFRKWAKKYRRLILNNIHKNASDSRELRN
jgi:glycosyltransferase involved in cell wall biosynthesis